MLKTIIQNPKHRKNEPNNKSENIEMLKNSFGTSSTKIGNLCTPTYKFICGREYGGDIHPSSLERLFVAVKTTGYWKANRANKFIGRGTQVTDFCRGFSKGNWLNPGHEPILLDLEKLFLQSVSLENDRK